MKMIKLFSYFLMTICSCGSLLADSKGEEGERIPVAIVDNLEEAALAIEERASRAAEIVETSGEAVMAEAMETAPAEESSVASFASAKVAFESPSVVNLMSKADAESKIGYPGAYHTLIRFSKDEVRLEDGSWWKICKEDLSETYNWLTQSGLSVVDQMLGVLPDTAVITANGNWPFYSKFRYHLTNQQTGRYVQVNLSDFYMDSQTRFISSVVWLYDAFGGHYVQLTLNDGSVWNTLPVDTQCFQWKEGNVVIVGVNTDQFAAIAPYMLINVNKGDNGGAACVRYYK